MGGLDARKQLHKDDRGSALAMIIVIIAFIAILATVLMFASYAGYRMRLVDKQGKNTFYTAETVLDEINVGLQKEVSAALSELAARLVAGQLSASALENAEDAVEGAEKIVF